MVTKSIPKRTLNKLYHYLEELLDSDYYIDITKYIDRETIIDNVIHNVKRNRLSNDLLSLKIDVDGELENFIDNHKEFIYD